MGTGTRSYGVLLAIAVASSIALFDSAPVSVAAEPSEGTIASPRDEVTWSGGPFLAPNPAGCVDAADPTCDHFIVRIENPRIKRVLVAIAPDEGFEDDDYDLFVYDDRGKLVGSNADGDGFESVIFEHSGASFYEVRVQPFLVDPGSTYHGVAMRTREPAMDTTIQDCNEFVPAAAGVDIGQPIELSVLLLLDGTITTQIASRGIRRATVRMTSRRAR